MKYLHKRTLSLIVLTILLALPVVATVASAQTNLDPLFIMSPPSLKQDNFYVTDLFNTQELAPIASTLLVALGENSDTFTVTITPQDKSKSFTYKDSYMLFGFYYGLNGTPNYVLASNTYPLPIVAKIPIKSNFGFAALGLIVTSVSNLDPTDIIPPFSFTIKVELSATPPPVTPADEE
jgi:hypothetical protein